MNYFEHKVFIKSDSLTSVFRSGSHDYKEKINLIFNLYVGAGAQGYGLLVVVIIYPWFKFYFPLF